nr:PEGA domain-containing protein [Acidobacteriota bacterium]
RRYQTALGFASALDAASRGEAPMSTYERGAVGAAAVAPPFITSTPPPVPVSSTVVDDDFASGDLAEEVLADVDADDAPVPALHYRTADVEIPGERSLFDDERLEEPGLDPTDANETGRFADEFGAAAADLEPPAHDVEAFADIEESDEADKVEGDRYVAPALASSMDRAYAAPSINDDVGHEQPRRSVVPIAIALVFGLLLGAAGVYALFIRGAGDPASVSDQAASTLPAALPSEPAKPYSEGTVGPTKQDQPPASPTTPSVVDEKPGSDTPEPPPAAAKEAPAARTGRVVVSSSPRGAGVTVNGRWRGRTPLTLDDLPFGSVDVRVVQPGYATQTERVTLSSATSSRTLSFKLQRSAAAAPTRPAPARAAPRTEKTKPVSFTGSIYVDSRPRGARVLLDGKDIGTTPMRIPDVRIGSHIIRLQLDDHSDWTSSTRVVSGEESRVTGSLERIR